ncbi:MAG: metallophosphoesterase family protein [Gammaproteobacteria bacterium]|nr:metallophosphoesterase family protein [Gammaproteobacteria bacterium]
MTQPLELGEIPAPLLVFGGPYSNLEATRTLRREAERLRIPAQQCVCTGDLVAYCADPQETVAEIRDWGVHLVMGNCEESLADGAADCGCGFSAGTSCDLLSKEWFDYASRRFDDATRAWMGALPRRLQFSFGGVRVAAIHGGATRINRFLFPSQPDHDFAVELAEIDADLVLAGHCGIPFTRRIDGKLWHNAGVIGMPANDGGRQCWYSLLQTTGDGAININHHRLDYDAESAAGKMVRAGLTGGYHRALLSGLWPSLEVLPAAERLQTGRTLDPGVHRLSPQG